MPPPAAEAHRPYNDILRTMTESAAPDPKLLEVLVCPQSRGPLRYDRANQELISDQAHLAYPVREGVPILLIDQARDLGAQP
jgi:uncharacterized protein YbaR (Trm112 family)